MANEIFSFILGLVCVCGMTDLLDFERIFRQPVMNSVLANNNSHAEKARRTHRHRSLCNGNLEQIPAASECTHRLNIIGFNGIPVA